ncbi:hypothetical protein BH11PAT4_BH11PAT4_2100 [soil metagenome]
MNREILSYLKANRIGVLAVILADGTPHTATIHYSEEESPLRLFFQTGTDTKKCAPLLDGSTVKASFTVGFSEDEWKTLQVHGILHMLTNDEDRDVFRRVHHTKFPETAKHDGPDTAFLEFTPTWHRFTDFNTTPKTVIEG